MNNVKIVISKLFLSTILSLFLFFLIPNSPIHAATYYVAGDTGLDTRTALQAQNTSTPWQTIQKAANTVVAGDTVNVKGNITYTGTNSCGSGNVTVCLTVSGTAGNYITFQAWSGTGIPTIEGPNNGYGFGINISGAGTVNYNEINGFIIKNVNMGIYLGGTNNIISNNIIYNNLSISSSFGIFVGLTIDETDSTEIYNNVIYNMTWGVYMQEGTATIKNNVIANCNYGFMSNSGQFNRIVIDYNDVYNNIYNFNALGFLQRGGHDMSVDPGFVDSSSYNFDLLNTSPLIDAGTSLSQVTSDISGNSRPGGLEYDIGAYETTFSNASPINAGGISYYTAPSNIMTLLATYTGENGGAQFGMQNDYSNISINDVNGDGFADILTGGRHTQPTGRFYAFFGKTTPINTQAVNADVIINGTYPNSHLADDVAFGDINGDGINEVLMSDYGNNTVYIYKSGIGFTSGTATSADAKITCSSSNFGNGVAVIGDVNGDGINDYVIEDSTHVYLFYGQSGALVNKNCTQADVVYTTGSKAVYFTKPGDLNHDGYDDIVMGCPSCNSNHGAVYIFYGGKTLSNTTLAQADVTITGTSNVSSLGTWNTLADVNGDGISDLLTVGASNGAYVFFGGSGFSSKTSSQADVIFTEAATNFGNIGYSIDSADINNDSYNDIITSNVALHRTYVFYGGPSITSKDSSGADLVFDYVEPEEGWFGTEINTGDVNGDGYTEVVTSNGMWNYREGKIWLFGPPHGSPQINIGSIGLTSGDQVTGTITDTVTIGGVQASFDSGNWNSCSLSSGNFNCSLSGLSGGGHSVRIRSYTNLGVYIPSVDYVTANFGILTQASGNYSTTSSCTSTTPTGKVPWIYQAIPNGTSVTLKFTNWQSPTDHFTLEYGTKSNSYQYAVDNIGGNGTNTYIVNSLNPNTTYYFRVRTGNGCAVGSWSNEISGRTGKTSTSKPQITNSKTKTKSVINQSLLTPIPSPIATIQPTITQPVKPKFCILWWCW